MNTGAMRLGSRTWLALAFFAIIAVLPFLLPTFYLTLLGNVGIYALVALGLVLLTGVAGSTSFGQAAFMGVGAYTSAILCLRFGLSPWLTLFAAMAVTGVVALILGAITLRMQGHFLPLATIAWGLSLYYTFGNAPFTGGFTGLTGIPPISLFGTALNTPSRFYWLVWAVLALCAWVTQNLLQSRTGRAMRALRGGVTVAESFGVNTYVLRVQTFLLAAVLAAVAGWLYAHGQGFINPTPFGLSQGIEFLFMAVVGGSGAVGGAILGAGLITLLRDQLQNLLPKLLGQSGDFVTPVFGILVILMLQVAREGLWPLLERVLPRPPQTLMPGTERLPLHVKPASGEELLKLESVSKHFGGLKAVSEVSFSLISGEILGLIGPNGAGKSTLFNVISGVLPPTSGKVTLHGKDISHFASRQIARLGMARTFQHVRLFPEMTLLGNAMMGGYTRARAGMTRSLLHLERREEAALQHAAAEQLRRVGLGNVFELAGNLPLGQQRILEIARALVADPTLLLLDEPAAGLRLNEKRELSALLRKLQGEGVTILIVEHDMDLVMNVVDRLVVMNYGEKLAEGTPREIQQHPAVREAYLGGAA